ncbi:ABC transporter substrate-binding protein [Sulfurimonas sp. HSL3-7]|uniref:ABC transporter substrate-binding protein n=1 Tax=Sulfonitrofixus jiaomeiensis TaxID=3131938 RepID=UPI0031F99E3E
MFQRLFLLPLLFLQLAASEMKECSGLPFVAKHIYGASPPVNYLLYAVDPSLLVGLNFPLRRHEEAYFGDVSGLPVIGGWFGQGRTPNLEMLAAVAPDLTITWNYRGDFGRIAKTLDGLGLVSCALPIDRLDDYPEAFRTLGKITQKEARGQALADDFERRLQAAEAVRLKHSGKKAPRVYYAEGPDGLKTECSGSVHAELIERAGGENVHRCSITGGFGMEQITVEQLLLYDPDLIIVFDPSFYKKIFGDERFSRLKAVKEGKVYPIPRSPVNWFDRPPSFMRIAGLEWLQHRLWPEATDGALVQSLKGFFELYFKRKMSPDEIRLLLYPRQEEKR